MVSLRASTRQRHKDHTKAKSSATDAAQQTDTSTRSVDFAALYREAHQRELREESATIFRRTFRRLKLLWFQTCISLGPFMLDPWEQFLYFTSVLTLIALFISAVWRGPLAPIMSSVSRPIVAGLETAYSRLTDGSWQRW